MNLPALYETYLTCLTSSSTFECNYKLKAVCTQQFLLAVCQRMCSAHLHSVFRQFAIFDQRLTIVFARAVCVHPPSFSLNPTHLTRAPGHARLN